MAKLTNLAMRLSKNFTLGEVVFSRTAILQGIDNSLPEDLLPNVQHVIQAILQPARDHYGIAFTPTSFYRCAELCEAIGSKSTSQHTKGEAVDFEVPTVANLELASWLYYNTNFDQIILEKFQPNDPTAGWVHCSSKIDGNRGEVLSYDGKTYKPIKL